MHQTTYLETVREHLFDARGRRSPDAQPSHRATQQRRFQESVSNDPSHGKQLIHGIGEYSDAQKRAKRLLV